MSKGRKGKWEGEKEEEKEKKRKRRSKLVFPLPFDLFRCSVDWAVPVLAGEGRSSLVYWFKCQFP
jgi:hypothetical protein